MKTNLKGEIIKHTARLVAKGFLQREGIYSEVVFTPVPRIITISLVVGIVNNNYWSIYQMDVKVMFLNGPLEEEVYVEEPLVFFEKPSGKVLQVEKINVWFEASFKSLEQKDRWLPRENWFQKMCI